MDCYFGKFSFQFPNKIVKRFGKIVDPLFEKEMLQHQVQHLESPLAILALLATHSSLPTD